MPAISSIPQPLPHLILALAMIEPSSNAFLPMLELFLRNKEERKLLAELKEPVAIRVADILDRLVDVLELHDLPEHRKRVLRLLQSLCGSWGILPTSYAFSGAVEFLDDCPFARSGSAEVFRGKSGGEMVAVKALAVSMSDDLAKLNKRLSKEAVVWKRLDHPNILPLYGVYHRGSQPCLVAPWMKNGNIRDFVVKNRHLNRFKLLVDVCIGLQYLHNQDIVHGDLKGDNVLIDSDNTVRLADFGLASFDRSRWLGITSGSSDPGGTTAFMAPELFAHEYEEGQPKGPWMRKEADVYALGMLIYEVLCGKRPFCKVPKHLIRFRVSNGERPPRPSPRVIPDQVWEMLQACWDGDPIQRPKVEHIVTVCMAYAAQDAPAARLPPPTRVSSGSRVRPSSLPIEAQASRRPLALPSYPMDLPDYPLGLPDHPLAFPHRPGYTTEERLRHKARSHQPARNEGRSDRRKRQGGPLGWWSRDPESWLEGSRDRGRSWGFPDVSDISDR